MTDFRRLAAAFDVLIDDLEMKLAAKTTAVSAHRADLAQLKTFVDRPEMMSAAGYAEGLHRILRMEVELKRMEDQLLTLRLEHAQAEKRRDKCLSRARQEELSRQRVAEQRSIGELVSLSSGTSLAQSEDG